MNTSSAPTLRFHDLSEHLLHLRYKPSRANFKGCRECPAFDCFDWVFWKPDSRTLLRFRRPVPRRVLCLAHPASLARLLKLRFLLHDISLCIAGEDTRLSRLLPQVERLAPHCRKIFYEAKDIRHPFVRSFSMGFNSYYLERVGSEVFLGQVEGVRSGEIVKEGVLAAWGGIWKQLDEELEERRAASDFIEQSTWLHREMLNPKEYTRRLARSKYLIAPAGAGVQSPKLAEAWLLRTVPVAVGNPCLEDLQAAGYPLLLLDNWSDLTPERLKRHETHLQNLDWPKIAEMLTLRYFSDEIIA